MAYVFYLGDYGPVTANVFDVDGTTPLTPLSGTATIVNQHTGETIVENAGCLVGDGYITYVIPEGSPITATSARYIIYMSAIVDATTKSTATIAIDVLDKSSYLVVDRWRKKVEFAAPASAPDGTDPLSESEGRDWVDQAVGYLSDHYQFTYSSTLGTISPAPNAAVMEFVASVAALMARAAWWAGKGSWRDEEMSFDATPFHREWLRLETQLQGNSLDGWFSGNVPPRQFDMYNRDKTDRWGRVDMPDDYFDQTWRRDSAINAL